MRMPSVKVLSIALLFLGLATNAVAQKRLLWEQAAPTGVTTFTSAQAQAYAYQYYVHGQTAGVAIAGVACTTTNKPLVKACSAALPVALSAGVIFDLTATDPPDESVHSQAVTVPPPPPAPSKVQILGAILRKTGETVASVGRRLRF